MPTVKRRNRSLKRSSKKHLNLKRVSLKSKNHAKRHTNRKKVKRTRRSRRGGVSERKSAKEAISSMRAAQTYNSNIFNERIMDSNPVKNTSNCRRSLSIKQYLISIGYNDNDGGPAIMSVVRSLSKLRIEDVTTMSKNQIDAHYAAWRLEEAMRRKELRSLKKQGISVVRSGTSKKVRPVVPSEPRPTSRTMQIISNNESTAAYDAAIAMMELDKEIDEEIDADAIRVMHECEIDTAEEMGYTDPPPTITADTIPPGFTPIKVKPNNNKSSMSKSKSKSKSNPKPKSLFDAPSQADEDEFMHFMDMDMDMEQEDT